MARNAIIADLQLTRRDLLAALVEHWQEIAGLEMPIDAGCLLLAFAREVLLEPVVGACALIWLTLDSVPSTPDIEATIAWDEWSLDDRDDWASAGAAELIQLGHRVTRTPADADDAVLLRL